MRLRSCQEKFRHIFSVSAVQGITETFRHWRGFSNFQGGGGSQAKDEIRCIIFTTNIIIVVMQTNLLSYENHAEQGTISVYSGFGFAAF